MGELRPCPFCGGEVALAIGGDGITAWWFVTRGRGEDACKCRIFMESEQFDKDSEMAEFFKDDLVSAWNRRAQPDNSRQRALQTGICPMCEDCPDGCPVETPNDSRNRQENEPLTPDELRQMDGVPVYVVDAQGRGEWQFRINCGLEDDNEEWTADEDINWDRYGDLWRAYRAKPERSDT